MKVPWVEMSFYAKQQLRLGIHWCCPCRMKWDCHCHAKQYGYCRELQVAVSMKVPALFCGHLEFRNFHLSRTWSVESCRLVACQGRRNLPWRSVASSSIVGVWKDSSFRQSGDDVHCFILRFHKVGLDCPGRGRQAMEVSQLLN